MFTTWTMRLSTWLCFTKKILLASSSSFGKGEATFDLYLATVDYHAHSLHKATVYILTAVLYYSRALLTLPSSPQHLFFPVAEGSSGVRFVVLYVGTYVRFPLPRPLDTSTHRASWE